MVREEVLYWLLQMTKTVTYLPSKHEDAVYNILCASCREPVTPNEVAQKLGITQKTAQQTLMQLALTREDVKYKLSGRIHIFWKKE